jgi:hypothetical protein
VSHNIRTLYAADNREHRLKCLVRVLRQPRCLTAWSIEERGKLTATNFPIHEKRENMFHRQLIGTDMVHNRTAQALLINK